MQYDANTFASNSLHIFPPSMDILAMESCKSYFQLFKKKYIKMKWLVQIIRTILWWRTRSSCFGSYCMCQEQSMCRLHWVVPPPADNRSVHCCSVAQAAGWTWCAVRWDAADSCRCTVNCQPSRSTCANEDCAWSSSVAGGSLTIIFFFFTAILTHCMLPNKHAVVYAYASACTLGWECY